jgi:hypothetical protein
VFFKIVFSVLGFQVPEAGNHSRVRIVGLKAGQFFNRMNLFRSTLSCKFRYKLTSILKEKANFLFFCMIFVVGAAFGQKKAEDFTVKTDFYSWVKPAKKERNPLINNTQHPAKASSGMMGAGSILPASFSIISPNYYTANFGFFCKKELMVEKITKIPFRFRLGSVQQCDRLEGKLNSGPFN